MKKEYYQEAIKIRETEETFLNLFSEGKLNGTVHTCIGQEFSAISVCCCLCENDFVLSNHRCHGHYLAFKNDYAGLIAELMGKSSGVCAGIGSSQHLFNSNFLSNGIQGGIVPIAAGIALAKKKNNNREIVTVFIGDGTFGEGVLYETFNIASLWNLPLLIVCENNSYAQSTSINENLAGSITKRLESFCINTFHANTWELENLFSIADEAANYVRDLCKPAFLLIDTYRLKAHSKGDDNRDKEEIQKYFSIDPINKFAQNNLEDYNNYLSEAKKEIYNIIANLNRLNGLDKEYYLEKQNSKDEIRWENYLATDEKISDRIYKFFKEKMNEKESIYFIGEDVKYPYGGAFKIAKNLSELFPEQVLSTPISEAAITGIGIGLSLLGNRPFIEIMFGDFITLALDQIINHASKFYHTYNRQVKCPLIIRTPMGGRRGYGPTHSQSLEKILLGIDNVRVVALNNLVDPYEIYNTILNKIDQPTIVIENKTDYAKRNSFIELQNYQFEKSNEVFPTIKISPINILPTITIVTYGGSVNLIKNLVENLFYEQELISEVFVISQLSPIDITPILKSVNETRYLVTMEEGKLEGGIGSEIIASVLEKIEFKIKTLRIGAEMVPIPSQVNLENEILPNEKNIVEKISELVYE